MRRPLYKTVLQSSLDAAGFPIANIPSTSTKEVFITNVARTDSSTGTGTRTDPYDGSTQPKLDAVFKSYSDAATTYVHFHLCAGQFYMIGGWDSSWGMREGWKITGAGKKLTQITQVAGVLGVNPGGNGYLFQEYSATTNGNMAIEDLWCDCAWYRSGPGGDNSRPHGNFEGISMWGPGCTVRNVKVTGTGWADSESFGISISGDTGYIPDNALIDNVEISGSGHINATGYAMTNLAAKADNGSPVYAQNGRVINSFFYLPNSGNAGGVPGGFVSGDVLGNTFLATNRGIYFDTFASKNIIISNNSVVSTAADGNGILLNSGSANPNGPSNWIITNNVVRSAGGIGAASWFQNSIISNNRILSFPGTNYDYAIYLNDATVNNINVIGNICDNSPVNQGSIPSGGATNANIFWYRNRTPGGAIIATMLDSDYATTPTTLFVSKAHGNDTTGLRQSQTHPFLTINAAITAALSGDIVRVVDGSFDETILSKNNITVAFEKNAFLNCVSAGGCIQSNGTNHKFTVYHEHAKMITSTASSPGILLNHAGCFFYIHGDISATTSNGSTASAIYCTNGTLEIWGNAIDSGNWPGVMGLNSPGGTIIVHGNVTSAGNYAINLTYGKCTVLNGLVSGGALGAVNTAVTSTYVFKDCTIVSTGVNLAAIHVAAAVPTTPIIMRNCVLVSDSGATQAINATAAMTIILYGETVANKGNNPPTNVTFVGGGTYAVDSNVKSDF